MYILIANKFQRIWKLREIKILDIWSTWHFILGMEVSIVDTNRDWDRFFSSQYWQVEKILTCSKILNRRVETENRDRKLWNFGRSWLKVLVLKVWILKFSVFCLERVKFGLYTIFYIDLLQTYQNKTKYLKNKPFQCFSLFRGDVSVVLIFQCRYHPTSQRSNYGKVEFFFG